jgi:hypothetical protein
VSPCTHRLADLHRQGLLAESARLRVIRWAVRPAPVGSAAGLVARAAAYARDAMAALASAAAVTPTSKRAAG